MSDSQGPVILNLIVTGTVISGLGGSANVGKTVKPLADFVSVDSDKGIISFNSGFRSIGIRPAADIRICFDGESSSAARGFLVGVEGFSIDVFSKALALYSAAPTAVSIIVL